MCCIRQNKGAVFHLIRSQLQYGFIGGRCLCSIAVGGICGIVVGRGGGRVSCRKAADSDNVFFVCLEKHACNSVCCKNCGNQECKGKEKSGRTKMSSLSARHGISASFPLKFLLPEGLMDCSISLWRQLW